MITIFPKYWCTDRTPEITKWINKEYGEDWNESSFTYKYIGHDSSDDHNGINSWNKTSYFLNNSVYLTNKEFWKCVSNKTITNISNDKNK